MKHDKETNNLQVLLYDGETDYHLIKWKELQVGQIIKLTEGQVHSEFVICNADGSC